MVSLVRPSWCGHWRCLWSSFHRSLTWSKFKSGLPKPKSEDAPHVLVALQEATNMNTLINEIHTSLDTLQKGQNGS